MLRNSSQRNPASANKTTSAKVGRMSICFFFGGDYPENCRVALSAFSYSDEFPSGWSLGGWRALCVAAASAEHDPDHPHDGDGTSSLVEGEGDAPTHGDERLMRFRFRGVESEGASTSTTAGGSSTLYRVGAATAAVPCALVCAVPVLARVSLINMARFVVPAWWKQSRNAVLLSSLQHPESTNPRVVTVPLGQVLGVTARVEV